MGLTEGEVLVGGRQKDGEEKDSPSKPGSEHARST